MRIGVLAAHPELAARMLGGPHDRAAAATSGWYTGATAAAARGSRVRTHVNCGVFSAGQLHHRHPDAAALVQQLGAQRVGEARDGELGGAVRRLQRDRAVGERRADLHDHPAVARPHAPQGGERPVHAAEVRDLGDAADLGGRSRGRSAKTGGHRAVDPHVDRPELAPRHAPRRPRPHPRRATSRGSTSARCRRRAATSRRGASQPVLAAGDEPDAVAPRPPNAARRGPAHAG